MGNSPSKKKKNKPGHTSAPPSPAPTSVSYPQASAHNAHEEKSHANPSAHTPLAQSVEVPPASVSHGHSRSDSDNKGGFSSKKLEELFDKYKDEEGQQIGPEGIEQLCKDIGVDPEDVLVLVFAWHLNAQRMAFFSKEEFLSGLQKLGVDSLPKLKGQLNTFKKDLEDQAKFKDIYRFAFGFAKEKESKILDLPTADALLALVLGTRYPHTEPLRQFLKEQTTYKSINQDQWMNILEFSKSIKADLSNYDENSAWPVLLDEYCEWAKKHADKQVTPS